MEEESGEDLLITLSESSDPIFSVRNFHESKSGPRNASFVNSVPTFYVDPHQKNAGPLRQNGEYMIKVEFPDPLSTTCRVSLDIFINGTRILSGPETYNSSHYTQQKNRPQWTGPIPLISEEGKPLSTQIVEKGAREMLFGARLNVKKHSSQRGCKFVVKLSLIGCAFIAESTPFELFSNVNQIPKDIPRPEIVPIRNKGKGKRKTKEGEGEGGGEGEDNDVGSTKKSSSKKGRKVERRANVYTDYSSSDNADNADNANDEDYIPPAQSAKKGEWQELFSRLGMLENYVGQMTNAICTMQNTLAVHSNFPQFAVDVGLLREKCHGAVFCVVSDIPESARVHRKCPLADSLLSFGCTCIDAIHAVNCVDCVNCVDFDQKSNPAPTHYILASPFDNADANEESIVRCALVIFSAAAHGRMIINAKDFDCEFVEKRLAQVPSISIDVRKILSGKHVTVPFDFPQIFADILERDCAAVLSYLPDPVNLQPDNDDNDDLLGRLYSLGSISTSTNPMSKPSSPVLHISSPSNLLRFILSSHHN